MRKLRLSLNANDPLLWELEAVGHFTGRDGSPVTVVSADPILPDGYAGPVPSNDCITFHMHYFDLDSASDEDIREYFWANANLSATAAAGGHLGMHLTNFAATEMTPEELDRNADAIETAINNADEAAQAVKHLELDPI